jgi:PEP-CTERM motif-containing protein
MLDRSVGPVTSDPEDEEISAEATDAPFFLEDPPSVSNEATERPVYPFSIVAGGVRSVEEVRDRIHADRLVAEHYRDLDVGRIRRVRLEESRLEYVSYRRDDKVYWTRKALRIPAGEDVLTDGANLVRARCGNRLSELPQEPVSDDEPLASVLETPLSQVSAGLRDVIDSRALRLPIGPIGGSGSSGFGSLGGGSIVAPQLSPVSGRSNGGHNGGMTSTPTTGDFGTPPWSVPTLPGPGLDSLGTYSPPLGFDGPAGTGVGANPFDWSNPSDSSNPPGLSNGSDSPPTDFTLPQETPVPTPEPSTMLLVGSGIGGYLVRRYRRR